MPKITINDPETGKPLIVVEADTSTRKLVEQVGNSDIKKLLRQLSPKSEIEPRKIHAHETPEVSRLKVVEKIKLILNEIVVGWHTSTEVKEEYERVFQEEVKLATISTNLARLTKQELLERRRIGRMFEYRVNHKKLKASFSDELLCLLEKSTTLPSLE